MSQPPPLTGGMSSFRQTASFTAIAPIASGAAPDWVQLFPAAVAGVIAARDGRSWTLEDPASVVAAFDADARPLPVDLEHATEILGPQGRPAPAVGWLAELQVRAGALWGRIEWTEDGARAVASRAYRYLSPAFTATKATGGLIRRLTSVGLTNNPALTMTALARAADPSPETSMTKAIAAALGLSEDTSEADLVAKIGEMKAETTTALARAEKPDVTKFVARAEHDTLVATCATLRRENETLKTAETDKAIGAAVEDAIAKGFVPPAIKESELALCRAIGVDKYADRLKALTPVLKPGEGETRQRVEENTGALTIEQKAMCRSLGITEDEFAKELAADAA